MKPGFAFGAILILTAALAVSAQNLGLGTGSRPESDPDSTSEMKADQPGRDEAIPRKSQLNKRLGLGSRRGSPADPKLFEARGREIAGQFYEIGTPAGPKPEPRQTPQTEAALEPRPNGSRQWLWWVGAAGLAGASAGVAGFILMSNSHPASKPPDIPLNLDDSGP
jgi:hypothetical protein